MGDNNFTLVDNYEEKNIIKVIGVGGGGGNATNYMYENRINGVDFVICNTDRQALRRSPIPEEFHIQLGQKGLGAGNDPNMGRMAAEDSIEKIREMLDGTEMVFVTAAMGGGTGTGAAPVIARAAKEMGILTVGIITIPFKFEGRRRILNAMEGMKKMRDAVDAIVVISTDRFRQLYGDLGLKAGFSKGDEILAMAAKGIAEIITGDGYVNVDMNDVRTVMTDSGDALMGLAMASGPERAEKAIKEALNSPLLINNSIENAKNVLLNISYSSEHEVTVDEMSYICDYVQKQINGHGANLIWGATINEDLEENINVTVVITGLNVNDNELTDGESTSQQTAGKNNLFNRPGGNPVSHVDSMADRYLGGDHSTPTKSKPGFEMTPDEIEDIYKGHSAKPTELSSSNQNNVTTDSSYQTPVTQTYQTPVTEPVQTPVTQTYQMPVTEPVQTPVTQTYQMPVTEPVQTPVTQTYQMPVTEPVQTPVTQTYQMPVTEPVQTPVTQPVQTPVTQTYQNPATSTYQEPERKIPKLESREMDITAIEDDDD